MKGQTGIPEHFVTKKHSALWRMTFHPEVSLGLLVCGEFRHWGGRELVHKSLVSLLPLLTTTTFQEDYFYGFTGVKW